MLVQFMPVLCWLGQVRSGGVRIFHDISVYASIVQFSSS
jgi:hypothetical protein